jgi:hypothetical protein
LRLCSPIPADCHFKLRHSLAQPGWGRVSLHALLQCCCTFTFVGTSVTRLLLVLVLAVAHKPGWNVLSRAVTPVNWHLSVLLRIDPRRVQTHVLYNAATCTAVSSMKGHTIGPTFLHCNNGSHSVQMQHHHDSAYDSAYKSARTSTFVAAPCRLPSPTAATPFSPCRAAAATAVGTFAARHRATYRC